ncbi:MAG TPA: DUF4340 domain-containing protein [Candidatus Sulfotelmatobacter sp.]|nr:DUF4340 domain-containing protein [Candidatus Sulfotelmatobacter sp.]
MKSRNLMVATVVLLALAGTLYWSEHRKPAAEAKVSADTPPPILKLDEAAITKVELKKKDAAPIVLEKNGSGTWQITQPKPLNADQSAVSSTLSSLSSLNSERVVEDKASDLKQFGLDQPSVEVDVTSKDNRNHQLLIGDDTPAGGAVYAMLAGDPRVFTMASYNKTSIDKSLNDLRDKRLLTVGADKVSRLELVKGNQEIEFGRNKDEWQILKPKPLRADSVDVSSLVGKLADARMDLSGAGDSGRETSAFAHSTPVATAKITGPSGTQELQVRKDKDTYYAKSSVVDGVYKVDSGLGEALGKGLDDFRNKKLFDFAYSEPSKIEMHDGTKAYFLSKGGADWWSNGKKLDAGTVQTFISDLRDLSASKFVDSGLSSPMIELKVTSEDGKRVEDVSIAKSGDGFIAKRDNDSTLYYLDSSPIDTLQKAAADIKPAVGNAK